MSHHIPLRNSPCVAIVDPIDYVFLMRWRWSYSKTNGYALRYFRDGHRRGAIFMHRVIMERVLDSSIPQGYQVDHIAVGESNRLDNRRENLRLATRSQNQWNKRTPRNSSTGFKGVTFHDGRYEAHIRVYGKRIYLGRCDTAQDAALMYDAASAVLHGEYSLPNLPGVPIPDYIHQRLELLFPNRFGK